MQNKTRIRITVGAVAGFIISAIVGSIINISPASAAPESGLDKLYDYALYNGIYNCYVNGDMKSEVTISSFRAAKIGALVTNGGEVYLPVGINDANVSPIPCSSAIAKAAQPAPAPTASVAEINDYLVNLGYEREKLESLGECFTLTYKRDSGGIHEIKICAPELSDDDDPKILSDRLQVTYHTTDYADPNKHHPDHPASKEVVEIEVNKPNKVKIDCALMNPVSVGGCSTFEFDENTSWKDLTSKIYGDIYEHARNKNYFILQPAPNYGIAGEENAKYTLNLDNVTSNNSSSAAVRAMGYLSGGKYKYHTNVRFNAEDWATLYQYYLETFFRMESYGCDLSEDNVKLAEAAGYIKARVYSSTAGGYTTCYVKATDHVGDKVPGINGQRYFDGTPISFEEIINKLNDYRGNGVGEGAGIGNLVGVDGEHAGDPVDGTTSDLEACFKGASSLGWIVCPVALAVGQTTQGMYEFTKQSFLEVNKDDVSAESNSGTYQAWTEFRNFTNIVFIIMLLIIILSQVTGIGVSNYGIKKTLPTLIMVAILVNVSFYLCQLAIDVSNIVGGTLDNLFEGIASKVVGNGQFDFGSIMTGLIGTLGTGALLGVGALAAFHFGEFLVLPLILAFISAMIGIIVYFVLLGARQAGIIILVTLSPLAIICYALPNTKKFFDQWKRMFVALLMVYPICSILIGGGKLASSILLRNGNNNFFFNLVAILLQSVPFFFVPTLIKGSFAAMGNIGAKISQFGNRMGGNLRQLVTKTDLYQDTDKRLRMHNAKRGVDRIDAGRDLRSRLGLTGAARRRRQRLVSQYSAIDMEDIKAEHGGDGTLDSTKRDQAIANLQQSEYESDIKGQMSILQTTGVANRQKDLENEHLDALNALRTNPDDRAAQIRLLAAQRLLAKNDKGRQAINRNISQAELDASTQTGDAQAASRRALEFAGRDMFDIAGSELKSKYRGMHDHFQDLAAGDWDSLGQNTIAPLTDSNGNITGYSNSAYDYKGIPKLSAAKLAGTDDSTRTNYIHGLRNGKIQGDDARRLEATAQDVIDNREKLDASSEVITDMQKILNAKYAMYSGQGDLSQIRSLQAVNSNDVARFRDAGDAEYSRILTGMQRGEIATDDRRGLMFLATATLRDRTRPISNDTRQRLQAIVDEGRRIRVPHNP